MATSLSQDSLEIYNAGIVLLCGGVEFVHASELDALVESSRSQPPCLHTRLGQGGIRGERYEAQLSERIRE